MGLIIPKTSSARPAESSFGNRLDPTGKIMPPASQENGKKQEEKEQEKPAPGADAYLLKPGDFPSKDLPKVDGVRDARFQVVFKQSVLDEIHAHGKSSPEAEVCGVLIGDIYSDHLAPWAYVEHCIRGNDADGKQTQVTITSETWTRIHEALEKDYPGKKIVGWYHTHPGFGIFLSGMDLFIQDNFFNQPWQVATVYDPHSEDQGTFIWRAGKSVREVTLVEDDTAPGLLAGSSQKASSEEIAELTRRVKRLERRLDLILTGFLLLVFVVLTVPLIIFIFAPDSFKILQRPLPQYHPIQSSHPTSGAAPQTSTSETNAPHKAPLPARAKTNADGVANSGYGTADDAPSGGAKILTPKRRAHGKN